MQGEVLSPILFSLYVNDLESAFLASDCAGYNLDLLNLYLLMYADDTVLITQSADDLQSMLNVLSLYSQTWKLKVNVNKTKIMFFLEMVL